LFITIVKSFRYLEVRTYNYRYTVWWWCHATCSSWPVY